MNGQTKKANGATEDLQFNLINIAILIPIFQDTETQIEMLNATAESADKEANDIELYIMSDPFWCRGRRPHFPFLHLTLTLIGTGSATPRCHNSTR